MPASSRVERWLAHAGAGHRAVWWATCGYVVLTGLATWPLVLGLGQDVPHDLGDPLFVTGILGWVVTRLTAFVSGGLAALQGFWTVNIFHPEPLTLAYSDHFIAQSLLVLPVYWLSGNLTLCYNVAFLTTFVLSGLATFLLVRDLTGRPWPAFFAGVVFAFNVFRLELQASHLQVLSAQWMPLSLYALRRYFATGSRWTLVGGAAALVALNLSTLYFMLFFPPFLAAVVLFELQRQGMPAAGRRLAELGVAAAAVGLVTLPFLLPYLAMQQLVGFTRSEAENVFFAATLGQYRDAAGSFLALPLLLVAVGAAGTLVARRRSTPCTVERDRGAGLDIAWFWLAIGLMVLACWLSLGLEPRAGGLRLPSAYRLLWRFVPGYQGIRAPSRLAVIFLLFGSVASAYGLAILSTGWSRLQRASGSLLAAGLFLVGNVTLPFPLNRPLAVPAPLTAPGASLAPGTRLSEGYAFVSRLASDVALVELPFGDMAYDIRYTYFAARHRRPIVNGYSGLTTPRYRRLAAVLSGRPARSPDAWMALVEAGATHVTVHLDGWADPADAQETLDWLSGQGARLVFGAAAMRIYELPGRGGR